MRHAGVLSALLLTCALFCALPGLARLPQDVSRADESLRPSRLRTLTVWLMPGDVGDRKLLNAACAAFEKQNDGARVFLRVVTADEFTAESAVLPDVALFETGDIAIPEKLFVPLADASSSGRFAGVGYARALWLAPNMLSLPAEWFFPNMLHSIDRSQNASSDVQLLQAGLLTHREYCKRYGIDYEAHMRDLAVSH